MKVIIDTNVVSLALVAVGNTTYGRLKAALFSNTLFEVSYCGQLVREYSSDALRVLKILDQLGRARKYSDAAIETERAVVVSSCISNDDHIVALARVSKARILCTQDKLFMKDFRNKRLIDRPRGFVYSRESNFDIIINKSRTFP